jgi:PAS domain S-box-containing protein
MKIYNEFEKRADESTSKFKTTGEQLERQITQQKLIEETLRKSEKKYRTLLETLPQKIFHKDINSVYVSCNKNYADDLKIKPEEIVGKTDYHFYTKKLAEKYRADDRRVMETGVVETIEERYVQNGKKIIVQTVKAPIKGKGRKIIGVLGIFWDITDRKNMEKKLNEYQKQLRALALQITSIEEHEREKFAAFMHDRIGQTLVTLKMKLGMFSKSSSLKENKEDLHEMLTMLNRLIEDTRFLTSELSPPILYQLGLSAGLEWLVEQMRKRDGIMIQFEDDEQPKPLNNNISIILFRSVHELLINIVKHAKARKVKLSVERNNNKVRISVEDDGVGFTASRRYSSKNVGKRFGLFSIEERLAQLGGNFKIVSRRGHGTRASLIVPLKGQKNIVDNKTLSKK